MIDHDFSKNRKLYIHQKKAETKRATLFVLKSQTVKDMKVKGWTEIWVPFMCYDDEKLESLGYIIVSEWFWSRLIFV